MDTERGNQYLVDVVIMEGLMEDCGSGWKNMEQSIGDEKVKLRVP